MWKVYILKDIYKKWYYVGSTNRLNERLSEHTQGKVLSTKSHRPLELVFVREFESETQARQYERKLKDCRIEKEKLIEQIESKDCRFV